jgi:hypothetical protein
MRVYPQGKHKYLLIKADSAKSLCETVERSIDDGYRPLGGVCVERVADKVMYYQVMEPQGIIDG